MRLQNKVALVTGAADDRSIGWGIAKALAEEGADLILNDLPAQQESLAARVETIRQMGRRAVAAPADITDPEQVRAMMETGVGGLGRLDIAVSNAGVIRWEHFLDIKPQTLRAIAGVNLKGNMLVCQAAAEQMIEQGQGGRIIITSSVQAYFHFPITPVYGGTKHAMHIFVGALALELAPHRITVNHFGPGWVQTAMNDPSPELKTALDLAHQRTVIPLHRAGTIEEMGRAAVYFATEDGAYTTGAFIRVDGGLGIGKYSY